MKYRKLEIRSGEDWGEAGTKIIDLTGYDPISRIEIVGLFINKETASDEHPAANFPKVEVIDGSDVLFGLTGMCAQAVGFYDGLKNLYNSVDNTVGAGQQCMIPINFGRFLRDPVLAFVPKEFTAPQLKITWDEDVAESECEVHYISIYLYLFDEKVITPIGFLLNKEHYAYGPDANAYETLQLPRDYPMRRFAIQAREAGVDMAGLLNNVRFDENFQKRTPIEEGVGDYSMRHHLEYPPLQEQYKVNAHATERTLYVTCGRYCMPLLISTSGSPTEALRATLVTGCQTIIECETSEGLICNMHANGYFPHCVADFPLGDQMDIDDWANFPALESARLRIKAGASADSSYTFRVLTQQLRRY